MSLNLLVKCETAMKKHSFQVSFLYSELEKAGDQAIVTLSPH